MPAYSPSSKMADVTPAELIIVEVYGGRDVTDATTRKRREGPAILDPVLTLQLGEQKFKSEIIRHSSNPVWQQRFEFDIGSVSDSAVLVVTCEAAGTVWNSFLGEIRVPISDHKHVSIDFASQHWFPLQNPRLRKEDGSPGEIALKIGSNQKRMATKYSENLENRTVDDIYAEATELAKDSNESAHRSLNILMSTREIGDQTLSKMKEQGAQIERMQGDMDAVHNNMAQSERKLRGIESVWGALFNTVTSGNNRSHKKKAAADRAAMKERKKGDDRAHKAQVKDWEKDRSATRSNGKKRDNMIRPTTTSRAQMGQTEEKFYEYTDDTDRTLDAMDSLLDDLKGTALNMNTELDVQNKRLDILHRDVTTAQPRIEKAIGRCGAIVK